MKLKELKRTVNASWSPCEQHPAMLAAGSAAQQVDASFSSTSLLELYGLNLEDPGLDLELKSSLETKHKFQKLVWSGAGVIVGGCDGGLLEFYSADKLLKNASDSLLGSSTKHSGPVSALDVNPYQRNLLASGASDSEIFIWDLNNTGQPMAPGNRSQPHEHVQGLAWNQQVQHILGSTFSSRCVVWDLRKNEPIMKLSDSSRSRWRGAAWHPAVATQLCIASEDDHAPVIQLWDLRLAASPLLTLEGHQKGVLSLSWCPQDSELLLSAGKDGRILCWNPASTQPGGELLMEVGQQPAWVFEVSWSPRTAGLISGSSFDQQLAVHTVLAADRPEVTSQSQSNIMESFGGLESFNQLPAVAREPARALAPPPQPPRAPRWLRRPAGAKFGFGGKLVMFEKCPLETGTQKLAYISQIVSEPELVERAVQLDAVLGSSLSNDPNATEQLAEYCRARGDASTEQAERYTWFFLRANFLPTFRTEVLNLLGFKQDEIPSKFKSSIAPDDNAHTDNRGEPAATEAELSFDTSADLAEAHNLIERKLANVDLSAPAASSIAIPNGEDSTSLICRALVCGNLEEAVELCLVAKRVADALVIASLGSQELLYKVQKYHLKQTSQDPVSLVAGGLLQSRWDALVHAAAPRSWRAALAALVTHCEGDALAHYCEMLGDKLASDPDPSLQEAASICFLCSMSAERLVGRWAGRGARDAAALAGLTERALLARRAAAARARALPAGSALDAVLNEYAFRLAAQGCLQSALSALEGLPREGLRARLLRALGQDQQPAQPQPGQFNRNRTFSSHSQKQTHPAHNDINTYNTVSSPYEQDVWRKASMPTANPFQHNSFSQQLQSQPLQPQPLQPQPLQPQPLQPQTQPPQRPGSVGPHSGGLTSRSKYKVDPSVAAAPLYNQYSFNNPAAGAGYNSPLPEQYSSSSVPAPGFTPINNNTNPAAPLQPAAAAYAPAVNGGYYQPRPPPELAAAAAPAPAPAAARTVAPGWNDPPVMSTKTKSPYAAAMSALHAGTRQWSHIIEQRRHHEPKQEVPAQAPITHPLFGVEPPQHLPLAGAPGQYDQYSGQTYPGQMPGQYPGQMPAQYQPVNQQYPGQQYQQQVPPQNYPDQMNQAYQQQGRESPPAPPQPAPVVKKPIPDQYAPMVNVFESLRNECYNRAANLQMKRKLEDVQRRLESLYDLLRENSLSETGLSTLQSCASLASRGELSDAAAAAASLAAGAEFAAVASFLPALRGLFQLAAQLQQAQ